MNDARKIISSLMRTEPGDFDGDVGGIIGRRTTYAGQRCEILRVIGTWQGVTAATGGHVHYAGYLVNLYLHRDERVERHVRVVERAGGVEVVDVDERVVFRGVA